MKLKLNWVENKSPDWKIVSVIAPDGFETKDVSVNKVSKKGEVFPNFDNLAAGQEVEAVMWKSPSNKWYLFPPQAESPRGGAPRGQYGGINKAMETKKENIKDFQENKQESIKMSQTLRDAVQLAIAEGKPNQENILRWRKWLWENFEANDSMFDPFPSKSKVVSTGDDISQDDINAEFNAYGN